MDLCIVGIKDYSTSVTHLGYKFDAFLPFVGSCYLGVDCHD